MAIGLGSAAAKDVEGLLKTYGCHWRRDLPGLLVSNERNFRIFKLREINLNDTIQTEQLDLQKAFKQEKADDSNAMQNSKRRPKNDVGIRWGQFS